MSTKGSTLRSYMPPFPIFCLREHMQTITQGGIDLGLIHWGCPIGQPSCYILGDRQIHVSQGWHCTEAAQLRFLSQSVTTAQPWLVARPTGAVGFCWPRMRLWAVFSALLVKNLRPIGNGFSAYLCRTGIEDRCSQCSRNFISV